MLFPTCPQDVELKFSYPMCVSFFTELEKKNFFFLNPDLIPK